LWVISVTSVRLRECLSDYFCRDIPLVICAYLGWKFFKGTKILLLDEIPIQAALEEIEQMPEEKIPPARGWHRLNILWG
jgi:yeast amino acid transporter